MKKIVCFTNKKNSKKFFSLIEDEVEAKVWANKSSRDPNEKNLNHPFFIDFRENPDNFDCQTVKRGEKLSREDLKDVLKSHNELYYDYFKMNEGLFNDVKKKNAFSTKEISIAENFWGFNESVKMPTNKIAELYNEREGKILRIIDSIVNFKFSKKRVKNAVVWAKEPKNEFHSFKSLSDYVFKNEKYANYIEYVAYGLDNQFKNELFYFVDPAVSKSFKEKINGILKESGLAVAAISKKYNLKEHLVKEVLRRGGKAKEKKKRIPVVLTKESGKKEFFSSLSEAAKELTGNEQAGYVIKKYIETKDGHSPYGILSFSYDNVMDTDERLMNIFQTGEVTILKKYFYKKHKTVKQTKNGSFYKKRVYVSFKKFMSVVFFEHKIILSFPDQEQIVIKRDSTKDEFLISFENKIKKLSKDKILKERGGSNG